MYSKLIKNLNVMQANYTVNKKIQNYYQQIKTYCKLIKI